MKHKFHPAEIPNGGLRVNWAWVRKSLIRSERIPDGKSPGSGETILKCADKCMKTAMLLSRPRAASIKKAALDFKQGSIVVDGPFELSSKALSKYLKGALELHFFLVTIGSGVENTASRWMANEKELGGYLLDRIGSFAVESLAMAAEEKLRRSCRAKKLSVSMRLSPGYCDWPIEEQRKLDKLIGFSGADVRLTKACVMLPRKTISAVLGVGPTGLFSKKISQCVICGKKDCDYRRVSV